ncbi:hypothetical protein HMPREF1986_02223 [Oribacterium sp. oral taxon 078 str. F0263]|nr:hypothetical protein HMPREF1986_02223 [Oribacterium sp. oral taxon 078 str. F0263]
MYSSFLSFPHFLIKKALDLSFPSEKDFVFHISFCSPGNILFLGKYSKLCIRCRVKRKRQGSAEKPRSLKYFRF